MKQAELLATGDDEAANAPGEPMDLWVTLDLAAGSFLFQWQAPGAAVLAGYAELEAAPHRGFWWYSLTLNLDVGGKIQRHGCNSRGTSAHALVARLRKRFPVPDERVHLRVKCDRAQAPHAPDAALSVPLPPDIPAWKWLGRQVQAFARMVEAAPAGTAASERPGPRAAQALAREWLGAHLDAPEGDHGPGLFASQAKPRLRLCVTVNVVENHVRLEWTESPGGRSVATGQIECTGSNELAWTLSADGRCDQTYTTHDRRLVRAALGLWLTRFPSDPAGFAAFMLKPQRHSPTPVLVEMFPLEPGQSPADWVTDRIGEMAEALRPDFGTRSFEASPLEDMMDGMGPLLRAEAEREARRAERREERRAEEEARRRQLLESLAEKRRRREKLAQERRAAEAKTQPKPHASTVAQAGPTPRSPLPPVPLRIELPRLEFQETTFPLADLRHYALRERAALWWVSNQSDDLLCLPHCRILRLDYQERTALRVLGPLRGRALLSDEVGLGKTIEAGLVLKELLTRGMVKRFLVLTVPSLVDQWEEELNDKFGLTTATTNQAAARGDPQRFWRDNLGLIASLHTLKQPAQLEIARQEHWDMLIVDEAHYLRNRESQAWKAVNALSRQFLLLLTATPIQNSLAELYNLVTLLQPGQLPSPKEFQARFVDPKRPRQPREPEELRRLLGQVMIRNTRANAGLHLPPRRAETVLFEPEPAERGFWEQWEAEFRARLAQLSPSQASLWGRLLLQAAGSSPMAWREALKKFPDPAAAQAWSAQAPLEGSWRRKCELLLPLARVAGGIVIFTQFLDTQAALAEELRRAGLETFVINGATPPPKRQPITESFRRQGGALLLTRSGTEGRNLQFSHRLANFDLPWNPMEIEQRIGRLHRLGQQEPVRIYNFVQAGTLQEHLLHLLQEKLNLFELVVGETGLVLGERFSSDEFAEEVLRRWRESEGSVAQALAGLGEELAAARDNYSEIKKLDETLFEKDYET
ncbi:MAG TPA: DEAD/DEAH box helicase [Dongiaceae bacterium]|nr:DEAD/DEAH box helicase [Dongiaceae bacterium]